jgi:pimeloyl-ACP methyl ester carboxylesterase
MRCTTETTSRSQASEEAAAPSVITKEHIVMSRRLISPDSSATISGEVAAGTLVEGRARLAGGELAYTRAGNGPVVLLIHGLGGTRRTWRALILGLAIRFTVIAPDLPGHGDSEPPAGDYSLGAHACAVRDLLIALDHSRASILGHSLGGGVALQFAYQFPERTDRLVLISSGGLGTEVTPMLRAATLPGAGTVVGGLSRLPVALTRPIVRALPLLAARSDARPLAEGLRGLSELRRRTAFVRTADTVLDWRGQTVSASRQTNLLSDIPVLLAWGADDKTIPPRHQRAFAGILPHAVTVEIAAAGHYPHETASTQLLPALIAFLSTTTAFRYSETRWRHLLTHQEIGRIDHAAGSRTDARTSGLNRPQNGTP